MKPHKEDIFKIQSPIGGPGPVLIYNKSRDVFAQTSMTPELARILAGKYKAYVRAFISEDGIFTIISKLQTSPPW